MYQLLVSPNEREKKAEKQTNSVAHKTLLNHNLINIRKGFRQTSAPSVQMNQMFECTAADRFDVTA